jgi:hypothetical protein
MAALIISHILQKNPIGSALDSFRTMYEVTCEISGLPPSTDSLQHIGDIGNHQPTHPNCPYKLTCLDLKTLIFGLVLKLQGLPASRLLFSRCGRGTLRHDLVHLATSVGSSDFDIERAIPLLRDVIKKEPDHIIFEKVCANVIESTHPRPLAESLQTSYEYNTSDIVYSSRQRQYIDDLLQVEMGPVYIDIPGFYEACSTSLTNKAINPALLNRVHPRVIVSDYGKPIYRASSRVAMLAAMEGCIKGKGYCSRSRSPADKVRLQIFTSERHSAPRHIDRQPDDERRPYQSILASIFD